MTGFVKPIADTRRKITPKEIYKGEISHYYKDSLTPPTPEAPPPAPTIDDAAKQRDNIDRLRKRRGVLANIFGGGGSATLGG